jgi:serine/threonine protein phosphatase PrpC
MLERLIGTVRREYLDRVFVWNGLDLQRIRAVVCDGMSSGSHSLLLQLLAQHALQDLATRIAR